MCTTGNSIHIKLVFQFHLYTLHQSETSLNTTCLKELFVKYINGWHRRWICSKCHLIVLLNSFYTLVSLKPQDILHFLQMCCHFPDSSDPGSKSLQFHVHALIKTFDNCNLMSKSLDVVSCLIGS
jgi:hypothetical protein